MRLQSGRQDNYILFSDVHLGADLVQHVRPWTVSRLKQVARIDRELAAMLDHYRAHGDPEHPWRLVIAGDLVDFVGMSIAPKPGSPLEGTLTAEEREHGLGGRAAHAASKMRAVAQRHLLVFEKLAAFVADGHSLVLVRGNHDIDFHWETARTAFLEALLSSRSELQGDDEARSAFASRVEFHPWFYFEEGLLYVEHGHQFDAMCNYHNLLAPVSPADPENICSSFSDILLRTIVRPTRGLGQDGHDDTGPMHYVRLALALGLGGAARLGFRAARAIAQGLRIWRAHARDRARGVREEHERRMEELAERMRVGIDKLRTLSSMWPRPVTRGVLAVFRSLFLDRVALFALLALSIVLCLILLPGEAGLPISMSLGAVGVGYAMWSGRLRRLDVDPKIPMRRAAKRIAELFPVRFVIMGHTHEPLTEELEGDTTYVNLGHWGVDDLDDPNVDAPRTHLVLRFIDGEHRAEFLRWDPELGPVPVLNS